MLVLFFIVVLIVLVVSCGYIRIYLDDVYITNIPVFKYEFKIKIGIYLFKRIRILGITINKKKIKKSKIIKRISKKLETENIDIPFLDMIDIIKKVKLNLIEFNTDIKIGTEDVILTSAIVGFFSAIIRYCTWENYKTL